MPQFSIRSERKLYTTHQSLVLLFLTVVQDFDCSILEGARDWQRQKKLVAAGKSQTMRSKHLRIPSRAVDVAPYPIDWENIDRFQHFAGFVKDVANQLEIDVVWGGDWKTFKDYVHWELKE